MKQCFLSMVLCVCFSHLFCQIEVDRAKLNGLLQRGKTMEVLREAQRLRKEVYGRCALIDYYIAKSLCLDKHTAKSNECFTYILQHYPMQPNAKNFIRKEFAACANTASSPTAFVNEVFTLPVPTAGVGGRVGKMGYVTNCSSYENRVDYDTSLLNNLQERLFERNEGAKAVKKIRQLVGEGYNIDTSDRYVIVSPATVSINTGELKQVVNRLEQAYQFYTSFYNLRLPDKLITVYLMPSQNDVQVIARKIHGMRLGDETVGYSLLGDLSIIGVARTDPNFLGTLYHELWHLVVRTDVGDISPWLDEGLASLYSVSYWKNDTLYGDLHTWRMSQLSATYRQGKNLVVPHVEDLVNMNWSSFNGEDQANMCQAAVNYSLANHFTIYLQQKKLLQVLIKTFKDRRALEDTANLQLASDATLIEKLLGRSIQQVDNDFISWFKGQYGFNPYAPVPSQTSVIPAKSYRSLLNKINAYLAAMHQKGGMNKAVGSFEKQKSKLVKQYDKLIVKQAKLPLEAPESNPNYNMVMQQSAPVNNSKEYTGLEKQKEEIAAKLFQLRKAIEDYLMTEAPEVLKMTAETAL